MTMNMHDEIAIVTGASRGLGLALSHALARYGAKVAMLARDEDALTRAAREVGEHGEVLAIAVDIGDPSQTPSIAARVAARFGPATIVVHNASTLGAVPLQLLADTDPRVFASTMATNLIGPFALSHAVVGSMVLRGHGTLVHISSDAAVEPYPRWGAYAVSKAGLDHLARIWAAELDGTGVRVLAIDPGEMDTQMHADAIPDADRGALARPSDVAARIVALLGRRERALPVRVQAADIEVTA